MLNGEAGEGSLEAAGCGFKSLQGIPPHVGSLPFPLPTLLQPVQVR